MSRERQSVEVDECVLSEEEIQTGQKYGMNKVELVEACRLFRHRIKNSDNPAQQAHHEEQDSPSLLFEEVDLLLRQLRIFMSLKVLWALILEIDENVNGKVEEVEFIRMVAKLRGRSPMSPDFHLRSLPRSIKDSYVKLFEMMSDENQMIERDDLVTACKKLNSHVNTNSDIFRQAVDDLNVTDNKYGITDFLVFQAKLRKQKPEIEVALMSLSVEEEKHFEMIFKDWRSRSQSNASPQELRQTLHAMGFSISMEQCRNRLASVELDGSRPIQLREFYFILINMGAGSSLKQRTILLPGASYDEAYRLGFSLEELWELGYDDLVEIKKSGWSVHNVISAGFAEPWQMRQVGFTAGELRKVGMSAQQLKLAGFSMEELRNSGFSATALRMCCTDLGQKRAQKPSEGGGLTLRPVQLADRPATANHGEQRWWGTPRIQAMLEPSQTNESIMSLMSF